ncbi:MAG: hypothetical protein A3J65_03495 [Candidatus Buchananbacteria bacterium RIFCSPHIGHO2_02_FULL_45_11b]|uniref:DUF4012 domain-containing protein n=2 Tax=Candidatus Buchananiibacteriota TaxID=1817903 RepID=A0A1G1Y6F0_9BACT|nr:MAG: hypothetical protein A2663_04505 [Candidatus Buchananbacteria bacterium RIFCSPHIGHO2_01_FULL_46_12]OGY49825.1 MAG: hypothetical protein A3J65_03495 [Candidatus Buchananbacteria bacterium RIFCSPHIGHO2_02_FULL_45_11b]
MLKESKSKIKKAKSAKGGSAFSGKAAIKPKLLAIKKAGKKKKSSLIKKVKTDWPALTGQNKVLPAEKMKKPEPVVQKPVEISAPAVKTDLFKIGQIQNLADKPAKNSEAAKAGLPKIDKIQISAVKPEPIKPFGFFLKKGGVNFLAAVDGGRSDDLGKEAENTEDIFAPKPYYQILNFWVPKIWPKKIAVFILTAVSFVLPLQAYSYFQGLQSAKDRVLFLTNEAIDNLKAGSQAAANFDLNQADSRFNSAKNNFFSAQKEINDLNALTGEIIKLAPGPGQAMQAGLNLLQAGEIIAESGQLLVNNGKNFLNRGDLNSYFYSLLSLEKNLEKVINNFYQAEEKIKAVAINDLPAQNRQTYKDLVSYLPTVEKGLTDLYTVNRTLLKILGQNQWQRYLVVFLNNNELRGGGGFMGSFALLDINQGQIKKLEIPGGGTYALQGQLIPKVISPGPLHLVNARWEFQDANWWPDFPSSAKKIQWFYQNAGGPSLDGVMAIDASMIEKLLEIFGPIPMPEYGNRVIAAQNFVAETQKIVELEYNKKENKPKQFLADLAPKLLEKVFAANKEQLPKLLAALKDGLNEKNIQVYFNDQKIENIVKDFGWQGEIKQTDGDYLSVVHSHIASGKTNGVIKEIIQHQAEVQPDGSIIDTVRLIRRHNGVKGENIFTGVQNNSYVRFYVPLGSALISAEGFKKPPEKLFEAPAPDFSPDLDLISLEKNRQPDQGTGTDIYQESGKTVFGNWLQLKPGEVQETIIKYQLPFKLAWQEENTFYYSFLAQKQPGSQGSELRSRLILNNGLKPLAKFPADLPSDENSVSFSAALKTDQFWGTALAAN